MTEPQGMTAGEGGRVIHVYRSDQRGPGGALAGWLVRLDLDPD